MITFLQEGKSSEDRFYKSAGHVVLGVVFVSDLGGNYRNFEADEDIGALEFGRAVDLGGEIFKSGLKDRHEVSPLAKVDLSKFSHLAEVVEESVKERKVERLALVPEDREGIASLAGVGSVVSILEVGHGVLEDLEFKAALVLEAVALLVGRLELEA